MLSQPEEASSYDPSKPSPLADLPWDMLRHMLMFCDARSLCRCSQLNRHFKALIDKDDSLFLNIMINKVSDDFVLVLRNGRSYNTYREKLRHAMAHDSLTKALLHETTRAEVVEQPPEEEGGEPVVARRVVYNRPAPFSVYLGRGTYSIGVQLSQFLMFATNVELVSLHGRKHTRLEFHPDVQLHRRNDIPGEQEGQDEEELVLILNGISVCRSSPVPMDDQGPSSFFYCASSTQLQLLNCEFSGWGNSIVVGMAVGASVTVSNCNIKGGQSAFIVYRKNDPNEDLEAHLSLSNCTFSELERSVMLLFDRTTFEGCDLTVDSTCVSGFDIYSRDGSFTLKNSMFTGDRMDTLNQRNAVNMRRHGGSVQLQNITFQDFTCALMLEPGSDTHPLKLSLGGCVFKRSYIGMIGNNLESQEEVKFYGDVRLGEVNISHCRFETTAAPVAINQRFAVNFSHCIFERCSQGIELLGCSASVADCVFNICSNFGVCASQGATVHSLERCSFDSCKVGLKLRSANIEQSDGNTFRGGSAIEFVGPESKKEHLEFQLSLFVSSNDVQSEARIVLRDELNPSDFESLEKFSDAVNALARQENVCTKEIAGSQFFNQRMYYCTTCSLTGGLMACQICLNTCHQGHDTRYCGDVYSKGVLCDCMH